MGSSHQSTLQMYDVLLVGPDNAGKSTVAKNLIKEDNLHQSSPTMGCEYFTFLYGIPQQCRQQIHKFQLVDLGGHPGIRKIWNHYYDTSLGLVFVFDASDEKRFVEVGELIRDVISSNQSKYILFCANKQDNDGKIQNQDQFEELFGIKMTKHHKFQLTTAICQQDAGLERGAEWLFQNLCREDTSQITKNKNELKNKQKFAGFTQEQKFQQLQKIKQENDDFDAKTKQKKEELQLDQTTSIQNSITEDGKIFAQTTLQAPQAPEDLRKPKVKKIFFAQK